MDLSEMDRLDRPSGEKTDRAPSLAVPVRRITSRDLLAGGAREIEIEHGGRIYRLRLTHANKLILTA